MRDVKSFSIYKKRDKDTFQRFNTTRHIMKLDQSEGVLKALEEFNHNHPYDKINPLENYLDDKPKINMPLFSPYTDLKEIKRICAKMNNDDLIQMKNLMRKINNIIELDLESRIDR